MNVPKIQTDIFSIFGNLTRFKFWRRSQCSAAQRRHVMRDPGCVAGLLSWISSWCKRTGHTYLWHWFWFMVQLWVSHINRTTVRLDVLYTRPYPGLIEFPDCNCNCDRSLKHFVILSNNETLSYWMLSDWPWLLFHWSWVNNVDKAKLRDPSSKLLQRADPESDDLNKSKSFVVWLGQQNYSVGFI